MLKKRRASSYHGDKTHTKSLPHLAPRCVLYRVLRRATEPCSGSGTVNWVLVDTLHCGTKIVAQSGGLMVSPTYCEQ